MLKHPLKTINTGIITARHIRINLLETSDKEKILQTEKKTDTLPTEDQR